MKKRLLAGLLCLSLLWLAACAAGTEEPPVSEKGTVSSETVSLPNEESGAESPANANSAASSESVSMSGGESSAENGHAADANSTASSEAASQSGGDPGAESENAAGSTASSAAAPQEEEREESMAQNVFTVTVNGAVFQADFADTTGAQALKELLAQGSLTIEMDDYAGFEKVGALGRSLPAAMCRPPHSRVILCCIRAARLSCSMAPIPGAIRDWERLRIFPAGRTRWAAAPSRSLLR